MSLVDPCGSLPLAYAKACGIAAATSAVVQYLPQLSTTFYKQSSGSLSVPFYALQAAGGIAIAGEQIFAARDPWPIWLPFLCSTTCQICVALLCVWFDPHLRKKEHRLVSNLSSCICGH